MFRCATAFLGFWMAVTQCDIGLAQFRKPSPAPTVLPEWGEVIIPGKGCKFKTLDEGLRLTLPAGVQDLSVEIGRMNAPRVLQSVKGDFVVQVKVSGVSHPGGQSAIPDRKPFCSAGLLVWQDQGNYIRLERAALLTGAVNSTYTNWELRQAGKFARPGNAGELPLTGPDTWLRITRAGDSFIGEASVNGQDWTKLPNLGLVGTAAELKVGILAVNDTPAAFNPEFSEYSLQRATKE